MHQVVQFITKTKLPRFNEDTKRTETDVYEPGEYGSLSVEQAAVAVANGWAREVKTDD